jgi:hypothetical protein
MAKGGMFSGLSDGAKVVVVILGSIIAGFALAIMGAILIGIFANIVISGDVTVPVATNTTVTTTLTSFNALLAVILSPYTTIAALVIVAVLLVIFFRKGQIL